MIDAYLEKQYNNRKAVPEFEEYLNDWAIRSKRYRAKNNATLDIPYGNSDREILDIFFCGKPDAPLHIFIHGGYWQALDKNSFSFMAEAFNAKGENAVILNYDLCPQVSVGDIVNQIKNAINWLFSNEAPASLKTQSIQITGHSAGGHLVAELLSASDYPATVPPTPFRRVTSLSGLFDLDPLIKTSINNALNLDPDQAKRFSPIYKQPTNTERVDLMLVVGSLESEHYHQQSKSLEQKWTESDLNIEQLIAQGTHHFSVLDHFLNELYQPL